MATGTPRQRFHGGVTRGASDLIPGNRRTRVVLCGEVMEGAEAALMAAEAIGQFTRIGMTFGTVTIGSIKRLMMGILLRHERMTCRTITAGGDTLVTLVTQPLRIELRLMVACRYIRAMARIAIPWCGKRRTGQQQQNHDNDGTQQACSDTAFSASLLSQHTYASRKNPLNPKRIKVKHDVFTLNADNNRCQRNSVKLSVSLEICEPELQ